jgi:hypothetical protein
MATLTTITDDDVTMIDDEFMPDYEYETPAEEEEAEGRRPRDADDESLARAASNEEGSADEAQPATDDEREGAGRGRVRSTNEDLVASHGRQASATGLRGAASGSIAVVELRAPVLRKLDRKAILKFVEARGRYLRTFRDANGGGQPLNLVSMIETTVLETICEVELAVDIEDVTEDELERWITQALRDDRSQDSQVEKKMRKLKMDLKIEAPSLRVTDLYVQLNKIVKDNGWKHFFEEEDGKEDEDPVLGQRN